MAGDVLYSSRELVMWLGVLVVVPDLAGDPSVSMMSPLCLRPQDSSSALWCSCTTILQRMQTRSGKSLYEYMRL